MEFSVLMNQYLVQHIEAFIHPARTAEERNYNRDWMQRHSEEFLFRPKEHSLRLFYKYFILEEEFSSTKKFDKDKYNYFFSVRERVIDHCALGLVRPALFDYSKYSPLGQRLSQKNMPSGLAANLISWHHEEIDIWSERDRLLLSRIKLRKRRMKMKD